MTAAVRRLARRLAVAACDAADRLRAAAEAERTRRTVARFARCGARPRIAAGVAIHRPEEVRAGDDLRIGAGGRLMAAGGLEIGDNVVLSRDVTIYCSDHAFGGDEPLPFGPGRTSGGTVRIGDHVWIGAHVRVLPGVTIGEGAILGMGAVVARDVPARHRRPARVPDPGRAGRRRLRGCRGPLARGTPVGG